MGRSTLLALWAAASLLACEAAPPPEATGPAVRDSAGVRIVEHPGDPALATPPVAMGEPSWTHGSREGHYLFQQVRGGILRPDGSAVVGDGGNAEVVSVSSDGASWSLLAASGEGPGEVLVPSGLAAGPGDSTWVEDDRNGKLLVFRGDELEGSVGLPEHRRFLFLFALEGVDSSGRLLMTTASYPSDQGTGWITGSMVRLDPATHRVDTVAGYDLAISVPHGAPMNPFAPFGHADAWRGGLAHGRSDRARVEWRDEEGHLIQVVRWAPERSFPTEADLDAYVERLRANLVRVNPHLAPDRLQAFVDDQVARTRLDPDEPFPLHAGLAAHGDGTVWLRDREPDGARGMASGYTVLAADGAALGRVVFPRPLRLLDVAHGRVLGVVLDELDVEHLAVWTLPEAVPR